MKKFVPTLSILFALVVHASAVEWNWYCNVMNGFYGMQTYRWWNDTIKNINDYGPDPYPVMVSDFLTRGTLGAKAKGSWYNGVMEIGLRQNGYDYIAGKTSGTSKQQYLFKKFSEYAYLKKWYFQLLFLEDNLKLLIGQDFTPTCFFPSEQSFYGSNSFNNVGCLYTGRMPQLKMTAYFFDKKLESEVAAIMIDTTNLRIRHHNGEGINGDTALYYCEIRVPKFEGSIKWSLLSEGGNTDFTGKLAGGFQRYYQTLFVLDNKWPSTFPTGWEKHPIDAYVIGLDLGFKLGGLKIGTLKLNLDAFWGQNVGNYGAYIGDAFGLWFDSDYIFTLMPTHESKPEKGINRFLNSKILEIASIVSYEPVKSLVFEGGIGTVGGFLPKSSFFSKLSGHEDSTYTAQWSPTYAWYVQTRYKIMEMLTVIPEVGFYDYGPRWGFGKYTYWGLTTFIEFLAKKD